MFLSFEKKMKNIQLLQLHWVSVKSQDKDFTKWAIQLYGYSTYEFDTNPQNGRKDNILN